MSPRRWQRPVLAGLLLLLWLFGNQGRAETVRYDPQSRIQRPPGKGMTYLTAAAALGQLNDGQGMQTGHSLGVIFRPQRAADFQNAFYAWNTALVLQIDKQGEPTASLLSGDLIMRRYLGDMRHSTAGRAGFLGLGTGISRAAWSTIELRPGGSSEQFSFLVETGLEWNLKPALVMVIKGQYRLFNRGGHDHSGWSVHLGAGVPFPF